MSVESLQPSLIVAVIASAELACATTHAPTRMFARGTMDYECTSSGWSAGEDSADLYARRDAAGTKTGKLVDGDSFQFSDGRTFVGDAMGVRFGEPGAPSALNWLWIPRDPKGPPSEFESVERVCTEGGLPVQPCTTEAIGKRIQVEYRAQYVFHQDASSTRGPERARPALAEAAQQTTDDP